MDEEYDLVMPFVTVASVGGPHDDESFVAGYAMGLLDAALSTGCGSESMPVKESCLAQADLLAFRYGYTTRVDDPEVEGWRTVTFSPVRDLATEEA